MTSTNQSKLIDQLCMFMVLMGHFDSFGVEHVPKIVEKLIGNKNITENIYRIQAYNWRRWSNWCGDCHWD